MKNTKLKTRIKKMRESPLLAAFAALLLVIVAITLAVSCGGEKGTSETGKDTAARTAPAKTSTQATSQTASMTTTPSANVSPKSGSTIWSKVFSRKDPFVQQVKEGGAGTSTTPTSGTAAPSYTGEIPYSGTNGTTSSENGYTAPPSGGTGYTYPPPVK